MMPMAPMMPMAQPGNGTGVVKHLIRLKGPTWPARVWLKMAEKHGAVWLKRLKNAENPHNL